MESAHLKLPPNPCENASFLSKLFFIWTVPFLKKGYRQVLNIFDVYRPLECDQSEILGNRLEENWNKNRKKVKPKSLLVVILFTFWKDYALLGLLTFLNDIVIRLGQPFLLGRLLLYFREDTDLEYSDALLYATGIVVLNGFNAILLTRLYIQSYHNGMKVRVSVCSLIYRKSLRLSQTALGETSPGKMVNLLSNDVNRFDFATLFVNALWVAPLLTLIVGCLIWTEIGFVGLIGIFVVFTVVPILSYGGKLTSKFRLQTALKTDERVRFMDEIISGMQVIKMYAWEKPFAKLIALARKLELNAVRKTSYIRAIHMTSMLFTTRMALFCTMLGIALIYGSEQITAARIFAISSYFTIVSHVMSQRFSRGVAETAEALVALRRLQTFLELNEKDTECFGVEKNPHKNSNIFISMRNVCARWTIASKQNVARSNGKHNENNGLQPNGTVTQQLTLDKLNIEIPQGKLYGVIGAVGAGKSSLLQALLRELPLESGSIDINGSISYASQEPWIFAASVRQNILFGQEYDHQRYNAVVKSCALVRDFEQFENGDLTIIGERGTSLSGGQKARLNLARACYRKADIYLLDDPLSAVDAHVGTHIFNQCIGLKGRLAKQNATRILVTHQVHFLKEADWLIVLKNGKVAMQGTPSDIYNSDSELTELVGMVQIPETVENFKIDNRHKSETLSNSSSSSTLSNGGNQTIGNIQSTNENDHGVQMEATSKGQVNGSLTLNYFRAAANWPVLLTLIFSFIFVQLLVSATDYWVSVWTKQEESRSRPAHQITSFHLSTEVCISVQASFIAGILIFGIARSIGFYSICVRISQNMHNAMFNGIISTSMQFFDTNPSGRILNRFSKELGVIDEFLPKSLLDATQNILSMIGSITVAAVVNPYFLLPVLILTALFIFIRKVYLRTSEELKRLESITKSPSFTHLAATLNGLSTIRAYKNQDILRKEFDHLQDTHSGCWFMVISTTSMFGFSLDAMCTIFITCVVFYYMLLDTGASGENIGLAVSQAINLTGLVPWGVRQSAEVLNQMTAVERVLEYRDLKPEPQPKKPLILATDWPSKGCVEFQNVLYRYSADAEPVLRNLSFVIKPKEKVGIVGRTGAGKSSLIGALFRFAFVQGDILIDDIDTANVQLSDLRKQIAIIPQDPVLFSGTLRRNLDPFEEYPDVEIWSALEGVELKSSVSEAVGLHSPILPHGSNYSVGQRQLLCLARAILRKNRILVLDEATANVDPHTDLLIQKTIRDKFTECTVLTVAHRLHTIIDSDRVMVMDAGELVEFDEPHNLLQNENGIFYGLVKALGEQEFDRLAQIAAKITS